MLHALRVDPYQLLAGQQWQGLGRGRLPGEMRVELTVDPTHLRTRVLSPHERKIDLRDCPESKAFFLVGSEMDMAKHTFLKAGESERLDWHDMAEVVLTFVECAASAAGLELPIDVIDVGVQLHGMKESALRGDWWGVGEGLLDIGAHLALPGPAELIFITPEGKRIMQHYRAPDTVVRDIHKRLRSLRYLPLSEFPCTKGFRLWVNLREEKLVWVAPSAVVHRVRRAPSFHVAVPHFALTGTKPHLQPFIVYMADGLGGFKLAHKAHVIRTGKAYKVAPPAAPYRPLRVRLPRGRPFPADQLFIVTRPGGRLVWSRKGAGDGSVDFGWRDVPKGMLFKEPYVSVVAGRLHAKGLTGKDCWVGVGARLDKTPAGARHVPESWIVSMGTEYTVEVLGDGRFRVTVLEGSVEVRDSRGGRTGTVKAGEKREFDLPKAPAEPDHPSRPDLAKRARVQVQAVQCRHTARAARERGMNVYVDAEAVGLRGQTMLMQVRLLDARGQAVRAAPGTPPSLADGRGRFCAQCAPEAVLSDRALWSAHRIFVPYSALALPRKQTHRLVLSVSATCGGKEHKMAKPCALRLP